MSIPIVQNLSLLGGSRIYGLSNGIANDEPATVAQLNNALSGLAWKDSCRVSPSTNINLASPGASLDGVTLTSGDRVLVRAQSSQTSNGIYIFNGASSPMTRAPDASSGDFSGSVLEGAITTIEEGTSAGVSYRQTQVNFTIGFDPIIWTTFGVSAPAASESTAGIAELATQAEVNAGTDDNRIITPLKLANYSGLLKKYAVDIGDGSNTSYTITHNLNTRDVEVTVYLNSGSYAKVLVDIRHTTENTVTIIFASAPTSNAYRVVVIG